MKASEKVIAFLEQNQNREAIQALAEHVDALEKRVQSAEKYKGPPAPAGKEKAAK